MRFDLSRTALFAAPALVLALSGCGGSSTQADMLPIDSECGKSWTTDVGSFSSTLEGERTAMNAIAARLDSQLTLCPKTNYIAEYRAPFGGTQQKLSLQYAPWAQQLSSSNGGDTTTWYDVKLSALCAIAAQGEGVTGTPTSRFKSSHGHLID
jgi:hypothetical protein